MNAPSTAEGNWGFRISSRYNTARLRQRMLDMAKKTGRASK